MVVALGVSQVLQTSDGALIPGLVKLRQKGEPLVIIYILGNNSLDALAV